MRTFLLFFNVCHSVDVDGIAVLGVSVLLALTKNCDKDLVTFYFVSSLKRNAYIRNHQLVAECTEFVRGIHIAFLAHICTAETIAGCKATCQNNDHY